MSERVSNFAERQNLILGLLRKLSLQDIDKLPGRMLISDLAQLIDKNPSESGISDLFGERVVIIGSRTTQPFIGVADSLKYDAGRPSLLVVGRKEGEESVIAKTFSSNDFVNWELRDLVSKMPPIDTLSRLISIINSRRSGNKLSETYYAFEKRSNLKSLIVDLVEGMSRQDLQIKEGQVDLTKGDKLLLVGGKLPARRRRVGADFVGLAKALKADNTGSLNQLVISGEVTIPWYGNKNAERTSFSEFVLNDTDPIYFTFVRNTLLETR